MIYHRPKTETKSHYYDSYDQFKAYKGVDYKEAIPEYLFDMMMITTKSEASPKPLCAFIDQAFIENFRKYILINQCIFTTILRTISESIGEEIEMHIIDQKQNKIDCMPHPESYKKDIDYIDPSIDKTPQYKCHITVKINPDDLTILAMHISVKEHSYIMTLQLPIDENGFIIEDLALKSIQKDELNLARMERMSSNFDYKRQYSDEKVKIKSPTAANIHNHKFLFNLSQTRSPTE